MEKCFQLAMEQMEYALAEIRTEECEEILFIGKSIGTAVAAAASEKLDSAVRKRFLLYTPLEQTFLFQIHHAIVFTGDNDPWVGGKNSRIPELCREKNLLCCLMPDCNHSLETNEPIRDLTQLIKIMEITEKYISEQL